MSDEKNLPTVAHRITEYLDNGGLFNPELANHVAVRELILDARDENAALRAAVERVRALHVRAAVVPVPALYGPADWCSRCGSSFPCSTIRALEGTP